MYSFLDLNSALAYQLWLNINKQITKETMFIHGDDNNKKWSSGTFGKLDYYTFVYIILVNLITKYNIQAKL